MLKLALVYDRVTKIGGAERVLQALHELWPEAPLYTSVYNASRTPWTMSFKIIPSFLQSIPFIRGHHELFFWLMPLAFESFDFSQFDVVISITSEYAKAIVTKPETLHLCYCLTPTRYLWSGHTDYVTNPILRWLSKPIAKYFQSYDRIIAQRPDKTIAISRTVQDRIKQYYGRESKVIYPPVDTEKFQAPNNKSQITNNKSNSKFQIPSNKLLDKPNTNYYLVVSRLVRYKRVDLVVKTFNDLGWNLVIIGTGAEEVKLKGMAKSNTQFLGQLTDEELVGYYQKCQAVIFPTEEDFGIVPLEAQACGKPVIAYRKGGATETVIEGKTSEFFDQQTVESLRSVLLKFRPEKYNPTDCRNQAEKFSKDKFKDEFLRMVNSNIAGN